jgi:dipeptidyl-peptidase 4
MKLQYIVATLAILSASTPTQAQKKQFTMSEATNGMATTLSPKNLKNVNWQPGTANLWYAEKTDKGDVLRCIEANNSSDLKGTEIKIGELPSGITVAGIPAFRWISKRELFFTNGNYVVKGTLDNNRLNWQKEAILQPDAENIIYDKSGKVAYTIANNVYLYLPNVGNIQLSNEPEGVVCGKPVHRDEFGIDRGLFMSPKGNLLAYYRMDERMVKPYPIVDWGTMPAAAKNIKYPMAGDTSHQVTLCVYNATTKKTVVMQTGEKHKDHYLTAVTWSPDEKSIYIAILNRTQNHLMLNKYDAATGKKLNTLFEETSNKYVHPTHPLTFLKGNDDQFIWWSQHDGFEHLYLYNTNGKLVRQLTQGAWVVNEIAGYNKETNTIIVTTSKESPLEKHAYSVNLGSGKMKRIDKGAGMHNVVCNDEATWIYDSYSNETTPRKITLRATDGTQQKELLTAPNTLADFDRPVVQNVTIKAADGTTPLYGKLILPTNFDSNRRYPVIVYLYNGPNVQLLHNSFPASGNLWYEYMAQHGYIVFTMDGRGSWNRGLKFEQATHNQLGEIEMQDQLKGVAYLKKLRYVDTARMGVHGWSFGGFMTTSLMLKYPNVFKVGVAGGPVMDWRMYEVMYTERYMGTPQSNADGYYKSNLLDKVKNLQGKLLLIHGTADNVVVWQHSINFVKKCVDEGVQVDYFMYPGHEHNVRGKDRVHLMQKITNYFDDYLK